MSHRFLARALPAVLTCVTAMAAGCGDSAPTAPTTSAELKVTLVSPSTGSIILQTPLKIVGTGFRSGATVTLDGMKVDAAFVSAFVLSAVAPPHAAGPIDVVVTNPDGQSDRLAGGFTYVSPLTALAVSGNTALTSVGETSQLTVIAGFADGTTSDVTANVRWYVSNPGVVSILPGGLLSATALGAANITARYPASTPYLVRTVAVSVTPPGTFAVSGRVREPGAGDLSGVLVRHAASGQSSITTSGQFALGGLTNGRLSFTKNDYETIELDMAASAVVDVPMQRVVRIAVGSAPVSQQLAPNDLDYVVATGTRCQPCRLIRITGPASGPAQARLTWTDTTTAMKVWVNGREFLNSEGLREVIADVPLGSGEAVIFVGTTWTGVSDKYLTFSLAVTGAGSQ